GQACGEDFFLLPTDAADPPDDEYALNLVERIRQLHRQHSKVDGLVVLLDACYAGVAAQGAAARWSASLNNTLRYVALTATGDRPGYNGCFTRTLVETIRSGMRSVSADRLECVNFLPVVEGCCDQRPHLSSYISGPDPGLWLARNVHWLAQREIWQQ